MPPGWCRSRSSSLPRPAQWEPPPAASPSSGLSPSGRPEPDPPSFRRTLRRRALLSHRVLSTALPLSSGELKSAVLVNELTIYPRLRGMADLGAGRRGPGWGLVFLVENPGLGPASIR